MFASREDIQAWLVNHKITVNDAISAKPNLEATRTVRGQLIGTFNVSVVNTWDSPDTTPELIRSISGQLAAAYLYIALYTEDVDDVPKYGQWLYNQAIARLADIKSGVLTVVDENDEPIDPEGVNLLSFFPIDNTPIFSMTDNFA